MNRMHRSLWNPALSAWVAAPENARARGKRSSRTARASALTAAMLCGGFTAAHACDAGSTAQLAACIAGTDEVINLMASVTLNAQLPVVGRTVAINGNGHTLDGAGLFRGFFIGSGTTTVNGLTMQNLQARGGNGGSEFFPGGGGMGAGGAVFVATGAGANLNDVLIVDNRATGGNGGAGGRHDHHGRRRRHGWRWRWKRRRSQPGRPGWRRPLRRMAGVSPCGEHRRRQRRWAQWRRRYGRHRPRRWSLQWRRRGRQRRGLLEQQWRERWLGRRRRGRR